MFYSDIKHVLTGRVSSALTGRSFSGEVGSEGAAASPGLIFLVLRLRTPTTQFRFLSDRAGCSPSTSSSTGAVPPGGPLGGISQFTTSAGDLVEAGREERRGEERREERSSDNQSHTAQPRLA